MGISAFNSLELDQNNGGRMISSAKGRSKNRPTYQASLFGHEDSNYMDSQREILTQEAKGQLEKVSRGRARKHSKKGSDPSTQFNNDYGDDKINLAYVELREQARKRRALAMGEDIDDTQSNQMQPLGSITGSLSMASISQETELKVPAKPDKRKPYKLNLDPSQLITIVKNNYSSDGDGTPNSVRRDQKLNLLKKMDDGQSTPRKTSRNLKVDPENT